MSLRAKSPISSSTVQGRVRAGEALQLQCRVLGARPLPTLIWKLNDSQLDNVEQNVTVSTLKTLLLHKPIAFWLFIYSVKGFSIIFYFLLDFIRISIRFFIFHIAFLSHKTIGAG